MQLFPRPFDGARRYFDLDMSLNLVAGHFARFAEFRPQPFLGLVFRFDLLKQFFNFDICIHVMRSYPAYVAGLLPSFDWAMVYVALKDHPILNFLFQRRSELVQTFDIGPFVFNLLWTESGLDIVRYYVTRINFEMNIVFEGVDSTDPRGNHSNVDFVNYIRQNLDMIGMQMHAITILPGHPSQRLLSTLHGDESGVEESFEMYRLYRSISRGLRPLLRLCSTECAMRM